jgi:hypothetical protein
VTLFFTRALPIILVIAAIASWMEADIVGPWLRLVPRQLDALLLIVVLIAGGLWLTSRHAHRNLDGDPAPSRETFEQRLAREEQMSGSSRNTDRP